MGGHRGIGWAAAIFTLIGLGPLLIAGGAGLVAKALGCTLNEGFYHPCLLAGTDIGHALYSGFVMGWFMLLTIWLVPVAVLLWILWAILRFNRPRPETPPGSGAQG